MVWTVILIQFQRLLHNRVELLLTFVVPIAFFSVFALIFGGGVGSGTTPKIKVVAVDEVSSVASAQVMDQLQQSTGLRFIRDQSRADADKLDRDTAERLVRRGNATMAIVIRDQNQKQTLTNIDRDRSQQQNRQREENQPDDTDDVTLHADLISDTSDQVASQVVTALVSRAIMMATAEQQRNEFAVFSNAAPAKLDADSQTGGSSGMESEQPWSNPEPMSSRAVAETDSNVSGNPVTVIDIMGDNKTNPVVSMYAAGIAVMFLLFGATSGGGALLEEKENRTLDRLLSTQMSMDQLLLGKWFYITIIGIIQVTVMFVWAQLVFQVDLIGHWDGFLTMTVVTAAAAAAFGLLLATLCKTRGQLNGLSVILILTMSALGGSMVPRYVMSDQLQELGLWTFNAWALDGYNKIFWRDLPPASLAPQLSVLMSCSLCFLLFARCLAIRWETD